MNENTQKIQQAMNILTVLRPQVGDYYTIATPIKDVVNLLADVRNSLQKLAETENGQQNKLDHLSDEEREGILNHAKEIFGNPNK